MSEIIYRCQDIEPVLYLYIDNEINDPIQTHAIEFHFNECPPCFSQFEVERSNILHIKQILSSACQEEAPEGLREAIINQLNTMVAGVVVSQTFYSAFHFQQVSNVDGVNETSRMSVEFHSEEFQFSSEVSTFTFENSPETSPDSTSEKISETSSEGSASNHQDEPEIN